MKYLFRISLLVLMISYAMNSDAQVPADHPAMQMRKYYADIYTGQSIVCFETHSLDSVLALVSQFIVPAQVISVYSYTQNPYNDERPFSQTLEEDSSDPSSALALSRFKPPSSPVIRSLHYYWTSGQYYRYLSGRVSGRNSYRRSGKS